VTCTRDEPIVVLYACVRQRLRNLRSSVVVEVGSKTPSVAPDAKQVVLGRDAPDAIGEPEHPYTAGTTASNGQGTSRKLGSGSRFLATQSRSSVSDSPLPRCGTVRASGASSPSRATCFVHDEPRVHCLCSGWRAHRRHTANGGTG